MTGFSRVHRSVSEHKKMFDSPTTSAQITSVSGDTDSMNLDIGVAGTQVAHPFTSGSSWIRAMPSNGTRVTVSYNQALSRYDFVSYAPTPNTAANQLSLYKSRKSLYRPLLEGEIEIVSSGGVTSFFGSRSVHNERAGALTRSLDSDRMESTATAPTHVWRGHRYQNDRLGNEVRFGVVKRPLSASKDLFVLAVPSNPGSDTYVFTYESSLWLSNDNNAPLLDFREGEVYDDVPLPGTPFCMPELGARTRLALRSRKRYYSTVEPMGAKIPDKFTGFEIDCLGNYDVVLAETAVLGHSVSVPMGPIKYNAGLGSEFVSRLSVLVRSSTDTITVDGAQNVATNAGRDATVKAGAGFKTESGSDTVFKSGADLRADVTGVLKTQSRELKMATTASAEIGGGSGLTLTGAMGKTGRPISTNSACYVTGILNYIDPSLTS